MDQKKLDQFVGKFLSDFGGAVHGPNILIGEQLGFYKTIVSKGPLTAPELARKTSTNERMVREWLAAQAASGYVEFDSTTEKYSMTPEQAFALADENSPVYIPGAFYVVGSLYHDWRKVAEAYKTGKGLGWHEHHDDLFVGTKKFFRPGYLTNLVSSWLPALEGVVPKLQAGGRVADVGCGLGSSTIIMAKAYPKSSFIGYDYHLESIELARKDADTERVTSNVDFEQADAKSYPGKDLDLVAFFDSLHDMGDPVGVARHVYNSLKKNGTWMIVEPFAHEKMVDNMNPVGRIFYNASSMVCVPASLAQEVGLGLGAQTPDSKIREVVMSGGFTRFRRATETPFNRIFEARP